MTSEQDKKLMIDDDCVVEAPLVPENRSLMEQLLSPQALQRMMICGGGVLVVGFVGWLWSIGVFANPSGGCHHPWFHEYRGVGNRVVDGSINTLQTGRNGFGVVGVVALPLNLWFYSAQGLITIADGGHLWIPAAICCAIYAMTATVLRKPVFVYTLVGGVVLTGMLCLADLDVSRFRELLGPVTFLVTAGWAFFHSERFFSSGSGDFSRENFGFAFHRAGLLVLGCGLGLLFFGQAYGWVQLNLMHSAVNPLISLSQDQKLWAAVLIMSSAVGFAVEGFLRKTNEQYFTAAGLISFWGAICLLGYFSIPLKLAHFAILASAGLIIRNFGNARIAKTGTMDETGQGQSFDQSGWLAAGVLSLVGIAQFAGQFVSTWFADWLFAPNGWTIVIQLVLAAAAVATMGLRTGSAGSLQRIKATNFAHSIAGILMTMAVISTAILFDVQTLDLIAGLAFTVPLFLVMAAPAPVIPGSKRNPVSPATTCVVTLVACLAGMMLFGYPMMSVHWTWGWILAVAAVICLDWHRRSHGDYPLGFVFCLASVWQILTAAGVDIEFALPVSATLVGLALAIVDAISKRKTALVATTDPKPGPLEAPSHLMMFVGAGFGVLLAASRVMGGQEGPLLIGLLVGQLLAVAIAGFLSTRREWRHAYRALAFTIVLAIMFVGNSLVEIHWLHKVEIGCLLIGTTLLGIGHIGWFREGEKEDEVATMGLLFGSLLIVLPLAIGLFFYRTFEIHSGSNWVLFHEIATIVAALSLFGTGVACRIRSTTITGAGLLAVFGITLLALVQWPDQLKSVSVVMMAGGGLFFVTAMLLSIYRDRIVNLPRHIREKRGVFRVMRWR